MGKKVVLGIVALVAVAVIVLCVVIARQPNTYSVVRSVTFNAPPERVYDQLINFHNWDAWSPWAKLDPNMTATYDGPESGVGASYSWKGNSQVGEGTMTIVDVHQNKHVRINFESFKPVASKNVLDFGIKQEVDKATVFWTFVGKRDFLAKAYALFTSEDKQMGDDLEKGLAQLKPIVESAPSP